MTQEPQARPGPNDVDGWVDEAARWEQAAEAAEEALRALKATAGSVALDDPAAAADLPARLGTAHGAITVARGAAAAALERAKAAERAELEADAVKWDGLADDADARLAAHRAKLDEHLQQLLQLDGVEYAPNHPFVDPQDLTPWTTVIRPMTVTGQLAAEVVSYRVRAAAILFFLADRKKQPQWRSVDGRHVYEVQEWHSGNTDLEPQDTPDLVRRARARALGA